MDSEDTKEGLAPRSCEVCDRTDGLLRCSGCHLVYYCGPDHQTSDRQGHKHGCNAVKKARTKLEREEQTLRNIPGDTMIPENVFENGVGHFWSILGTRPYMRARYALVNMILEHFGAAYDARVDAVEIALAHLLDMLRLCRPDIFDTVDIIPALQIALDRDQEAYDFMKWWTVLAGKSNIDYEELSVPYLDIKSADILEEPMDSWSGQKMNLAHVSAVILIKLRILANLKDIQNATTAFSGVLPPEITDIIRGHLAGKVLKARPHILRGDTEDISRLENTLGAQAVRLCESIENYNTLFWDFMMDETLVKGNTKPLCHTRGSAEEAFLKIGHMAVAWAASPQAMSMIDGM